MKKTIVVAPNAGFCNRLRTMVSSIFLAEKLDMFVQHLWIGTVYQCANQNIQTIHNNSFEHYFNELIQRCDYRTMRQEIQVVYTEWLPSIKKNTWYNYQSYGQNLLQVSNHRELSLINERMNSSESFLIESSYIKNLSITKQDKTRIYSKFFIPRDYYIQDIKPYRSNDIIGICIRKGDFSVFFPNTQFEDDAILEWIDTLNSKILFCSDDRFYELMMRKKIKNSINPDFNSINYDFLSFLLLSTCTKIYGTHKSSFAEEASFFGGIDYVPLTKEFFKLQNGRIQN